MPELIDKGKLLYYLEAIKPNEYVSAYGEAAVHVINCVEEYVSEMPTIEPEVRHGRWETIDPSFSSVYCSECGAAADKYLAKRYKGCPFCLCVMSATDTNAGGKGGNG